VGVSYHAEQLVRDALHRSASSDALTGGRAAAKPRGGGGMHGRGFHSSTSHLNPSRFCD